MIRAVLIICIFICITNADEFANYLDKQIKQTQTTPKDINNSLTLYKEAYKKAFKEYNLNIKKNFPSIEITRDNLWVQYKENYTQKMMIDFAKSKLIFEVVALSEKDAQTKILKLYDELYSYDVKKAFYNDLLEKMISKNLNKVLEVPDENQKLLADMISKIKYKQIREKLILKTFKKIKYNDKLVYKVNIDLPKDFNREKSRLYKEYIVKQSDKLYIEASLIYAIIDANSGFNPMSKSKYLGFGLMHITSEKSGLQSYKYLTGYTKYLSSNYLYNTKNNIQLGTTYLKILFYDDLEDIKNFKSRWYCTIVGYKVGSINLAKAFVKNGNINDAIKIMNTMSSDQVYKRLMKKLPNKDTRKYLFRVIRLVKKYQKLLGTNKI